MARRYEWFRRFGDVPGVDWTPPDPVDRTQLRGHDAVPELQDSRWGESAWWPTVYAEDEEELEDGSTSESPASQYPRPDTVETADEELRILSEALELPGTTEDYHQRIVQAADGLFGMCRREPAALREAERLYLFDLDLLRTRPEILERESRFEDEDDFPVWVSSVRSLHRLYKDSGDLRAAERVAVAAVEEFGQRFERELTETRERLAVLEAEDA